MSQQKAQKVPLIGSQQMPTIMLGSWKADKGEVKKAVLAAYEAGYRGFDTANDYGNEKEVGEAFAELFAERGVRRDELFVQCKLWNANHKGKSVEEDLRATLKDLQLDYVDSFLVHWPQACPSTGTLKVQTDDGENARRAPKEEGTMLPQERDGSLCADAESHFVATWRKMEALVDAGLARHIGISNFTRAQIYELLGAARIKPVLLQNESHPYLQQKDMRDFCRINGIVFQAYSPLGGAADQLESAFVGRQPDDVAVLEHPSIKKLAKKHNKQPGQIVLRWHVQMGGSATPKSTTAERIRENIDIFDFELTADDMKLIDDLNTGFRTVMFEDSANHIDYPFKEDLPAACVQVRAPTESEKKRAKKAIAKG